MSDLKKTTKAAGVVAGLALLGTVLGFIRETALASKFGASASTDAYLVAAIVPSVLFTVVGAALGTTFIPVFTDLLNNWSKQAAFDLSHSLINLILVAGGGLTLAGELAAPLIVNQIAPGFSGPVRELTLSLTRIMMPGMTFQGLVGILGGVLQSFGVFGPAALTPVVQNLCVISSILLFSQRFGITAVAVGNLVGAMLQLAVLLPALRRIGYRYRPHLQLDQDVRRIGRLVVPVAIGSVSGQVSLIVNRILASSLREGSVSALNYASRLYLLPVHIFGTALSTVAFPLLARLAAGDDRRGITDTLSHMIKLDILVLTPMAAGLIALRTPIVQLLFQRGAFDAADTQATAFALLFFSVGIVTAGVNDVLNRTYYSLQDTSTPLYIGISSALVNIAANYVLLRPLQHGGLALGTTIASVYGTVVLSTFLLRKLGRAPKQGLFRFAALAIVSAVLMALAVAYLQGPLVRWMPGSDIVHQALRIALSIASGGVLYLALTYSFLRETRQLVNKIIEPVVELLRHRG